MSSFIFNVCVYFLTFNLETINKSLVLLTDFPVAQVIVTCMHEYIMLQVAMVPVRR